MKNIFKKFNGIPRKIRNRIISNMMAKRLQKGVINKDFSIICNNCWGGKIYEQIALPYKTPFVGMYLFAPCYINLLSDFEKNIESELKFINKSKYDLANIDREKNNYYPIGLLNESIEIHFLHYHSEDEARMKWNRRKNRINFNNLFFVFSERDLCEPNHIKKFESLKLPNKVCFTSNHYAEFSSTVWIKEYEKNGEVGDIYTTNDVVYKYFDPVKWLNKESFKR